MTGAIGDTSFDADWTFQRVGDATSHAVELPHDAMREEPRTADADGGATTGYFPGGRYLYSKSWAVPAQLAGQRLSLVFEGIYGDAEIRLNGRAIGGSRSGYTEFEVPLTDLMAGDNRIEVEVNNAPLPNTRWYSGSGIYRRVWLRSRDRVAIAWDGLRITTLSIEDPAEVHVSVAVENPDSVELELTASFAGPDGRSVTGTVRTSGADANVVILLTRPELWSAGFPSLYDVVVQLTSGGVLQDERLLRYGVRTIAVEPGRGLLVNDEMVLLRGGCVHHDNGIVGAATFRAAEFRRARIIKDNGFNAIRSAHNPLSRDLLDACDEVGLYVMDELADTWFAPKTAHDNSSRFDETWPLEARAMVEKDRNHASVIMYSIGNEIAETGTARGIEAARELSEYVRALDPDRLTTLALNLLLNVLASFNFQLDELIAENTTPKAPKKRATSTAANTVANALGRVTDLIPLLPRADRVTRDAFSHVDVAGYNYAFARYAGDEKRHPDRIIVGSESLPGNIVEIWDRVVKHPNVIGDFSWTAWDYLGEAGIGTWRYGNEATGLVKAYPQIIAGAGTIDITGVPGGAALLARATWGELDAPAIAVRPLDRSGQRVSKLTWRSSDAIESWSWKGHEGTVAEVEVYSADDEVELLINGRSLGRKRAGHRARFVTRFRTAYEPGELTAVGFRDGRETSRSSLRTAKGEIALRLSADEQSLLADGHDLAFVRVELADAEGVIEMLDDDEVTLALSGPGTLAGYGTAAPTTTDCYADLTHTTYYGRALAVLRAGSAQGVLVLHATSQRHGSATLRLEVVPPNPEGTP